MSWCPNDSSYLLTCGKDSRTICWDTISGEIAYELPAGTNWNFDVHWYSKIPGVIASSFDGKIGIYNIKLKRLLISGTWCWWLWTNTSKSSLRARAPHGRFPGPGHSPTVSPNDAPYSLSTIATIHPTAAFAADAYCVSGLPERSKKVEVDRTAEIIQEIRKILTDLLLKPRPLVTDELFDEIVTKVLGEDNLPAEVGHNVATSNYNASTSPPSAPVAKATAKVLVTVKAKEIENDGANEKSNSSSPGDVLVSSRGRTSKDHSLADDSSGEGSDGSKRMLRSRKRDLSPSPVRSKRRVAVVLERLILVQVCGLEFNTIEPNLLASGAEDGEICIWDLANPSEPTHFPPLKGSGSASHGEVSFLSWNSEVQHILAYTSYNGTTSEEAIKFNLYILFSLLYYSVRRRCSALQWNPNVATQLVVASDEDGSPSIRLWDMIRGI
ncbi:unnamed protein product [Trifolium pratense]|uniref:Uncharacterized protein n=1 Tax=Trifolium pratense TaxID=57577 RepID=A0ACB0LKP2_TRIPR|nr:unnamed protein product [Trifolium pratense]